MLQNINLTTYVLIKSFQSESAMHSCLNLKKLNARNRYDVWNVSDGSGIRTHNHLLHKQRLNHLSKLAKGLSIRLQIKWLQIRIPIQSYKSHKLQLFNLAWVICAIQYYIFDSYNSIEATDQIFFRKSLENHPNIL